MTTNEISPSEVENQRFNTAFRGFDTGEVKVFLARVAQQMVVAASREKGLQALVESLQNRVDQLQTQSELPSAVPVHSEASAATSLSVHLDAEAALTEARAEAATIVARAHDEAARVVLRARVERRTNSDVEMALAVPDDASVRDEAKAIVNEAKVVRERILTDLAKRRRVANVQLEQLRAAREKLLESMRESRRIVDAATRDLSTAEVEARVAADVAGRRMGNEPMPTAAQIERELVAGRFIGVPLLSDDDPLDEVGETIDRRPEERLSIADRLTAAAAGDAIAAAAAVVMSGSSTANPRAVAVEDTPNAVRTDSPSVAPARVDDLFARLRAERGAAADKARHVLAEAAAATAIGPAPSVEGSGGADPVRSPDSGDSAVVAYAASPELDGDGDGDGDGETVPSAAGVRRPSAPAGYDDNPVPLRQPSAPDATVDRYDLIEPDTPYIGAVPIEPPRPEGQRAASSSVPASPSSVPDASGAHGADASHVESRAAEGRSASEMAPSAELRTERLSRALKRALQDEHSAVLASIRTSRGRPELAEVLPSESDHRSRYLAIVLAAFPDDEHERMRGVGRPVVDDMIGEVRSAVATALLLSDTSEAEVSQSINGTYRSWRTERIGPVAAVLVSAAVVAGSS